jgi:hypothetical protein
MLSLVVEELVLAMLAGMVSPQRRMPYVQCILVYKAFSAMAIRDFAKDVKELTHI